jgi:hypothetical protein
MNQTAGPPRSRSRVLLAPAPGLQARLHSKDAPSVSRLCDIETDGRDGLHDWLLRIVDALTAPTSMALTRRWRSRPQHQQRTSPLTPFSYVHCSRQGMDATYEVPIQHRRCLCFLAGAYPPLRAGTLCLRVLKPVHPPATNLEMEPHEIQTSA